VKQFRWAPIAAAAAVLSLCWPGAAHATGECDGLDVCISVPGPWVAVPAAPAGSARVVYYQLTCPRRTVVGGLDAVLGDRALDVNFLGALGSPVNPGITTRRSVVFVATYARRRTTYFRPLIGCIPTSGGGGRSTTAVNATLPPLRRVQTLRVRPGAPQRLVVGCRFGERLVDSSHAVAFRMRSAPSAAILAGAGAARQERRGQVEVRARRSAAVPAGVQVHALCARGSP
jgi:hypothetical protein